MVNNLTTEPTICVAPTAEIKRYLEKMIREVRGAEIAKSTSVIVISDKIDISKLYGRDEKITIEHSFYDLMREWKMDDVAEQTYQRLLINESRRKG